VIGITGLSLKNLVAIASRAKVDCMISYCRYNLMIDDMNAILRCPSGILRRQKFARRDGAWWSYAKSME
jgi:hypothetical protein